MFAKVLIFQLARQTLNSRRVIHAIRAASFTRIASQDFLSRLCIDLTCKSFARNASFVSGVNAPLPSNTLFFRGILPDRVLCSTAGWSVLMGALLLSRWSMHARARSSGRNAHIRSSILHYVRKSHDWKNFQKLVRTRKEDLWHRNAPSYFQIVFWNFGHA